jgi:hypothetical membrane protein
VYGIARMAGPRNDTAMANDSAVPDSAASGRGRGYGWAVAGLVAQVAFVGGWLLAAAWQGSRYSVLRHSISDMYAMGAPAAAFLIVLITACGAATILFAVFALRPALRAAGRSATVGCGLLALSICGLGDLLTPWEREACRQADPGCTAAEQTANAGGWLDGTLSAIGVLLLVVAAFVLAAAMRRAPGWRRWAVPTRLGAVVLILLAVGTGVSGPAGLDGLFERLLAAAGAAGIAALAAGVLRRSTARQ